MYSDGCIFYNKSAQSYSAKIKLQEQDSDVLNLFDDIFKFTHAIEVKDGKNYPYIHTYNRELVLELVKNGVLPDKSCTNKEFLMLPNIDKKILSIFYKGVI